MALLLLFLLFNVLSMYKLHFVNSVFINEDDDDDDDDDDALPFGG